jgi:hypothetical protein
MHHRSRHGRDKEKSRYYLLPGMGGRLYRKKQKVIIKWAIIAALVVSVIVAALIYLLSQPNNAFTRELMP